MVTLTGGKRYLVQQRRADTLLKLIKKEVLFSEFSEYLSFGHKNLYLEDFPGVFIRTKASRLLKRTFFDHKTRSAVYESTDDFKFPFYIEIEGASVRLVIEKQKTVYV